MTRILNNVFQYTGPWGKIIGRTASRSSALIGTALMLLVPPQQALAQKIAAQSGFDPAVVTLGQRTNYIVVLEDAQSELRFQPPAIEGLKLTYRGPSQRVQTSIVNGRVETTRTITFMYSAEPNESGKYTVPAYEMEFDGKNYAVPAATLTVLPPDGNFELKFEDFVVLTLSCPDEKIYVGQNVLCMLEVNTLHSLQVSRYSQPTQIGDAFAQGGIDGNGTSGSARLNDYNYRKTSFPVTFTPLKSGKQTISYEMPVEIILPRQNRTTRSSRDDVFGRFFDDDFFGSAFGGQRRQVTATTGDIVLDVKPLPEENKPENFSGAIGKFTARQSLASREVHAGDPLSLTLTISGEGNFDRIQAVDLDPGPDWRIYDPNTEFTAQDELNLRGTKSFEYVIIPQTTDITLSPEIRFSYFDPETSEYADISPAPVPIKVNEALAGASVYGPVISANSASTRATSAPTLLPIKLLSGTWVSSIQPAFRTTTFLYAQLAPLLILGGIIIIRKRQLRLREDDAYARRLQAGRSTRKWLQAAKAAASANDAPEFYAAAQRSIQESLGKHFRHSAETLTLAEIESFLTERESSTEVIEEVRELFEAADAIKFAGSMTEAPSLTEQDKSLNRLVSKLSALK